MPEEKSKLIPFTKELEAAIEEDARRCRRAFARQVEAVLMTYYGIADVGLDQEKMQLIGAVKTKGKKSLPVIEANRGKKDKIGKKEKRSA